MSSQCYGVDGTPYSTNLRYVPCDPTAEKNGKHTACCAPGDNCMSNGLCQSQADAARKGNLFWRNGCTDSTWNSPACAKVCLMMDDPATQGVYYCLSGNYCCPTQSQMGGNLQLNYSCCNMTNATFTAADPVVNAVAQVSNFVATSLNGASATAQAQSSTRASGSAASLATSSSQATGSSADTSTSNSSGTNTTAIAVGVPLGILLAIALGVIAWLAMKNKKLKQGAATHELPATYAQPHYHQEKPPEHPVYPVYTPEQQRVRPNEMPGNEVAQELQGGGRWPQYENRQ